MHGAINKECEGIHIQQAKSELAIMFVLVLVFTVLCMVTEFHYACRLFEHQFGYRNIYNMSLKPQLEVNAQAGMGNRSSVV